MMFRLAVLFLLYLPVPCFAQHAVDVKFYHFEIEVTDLSDAITGKALIDVEYLQDATEIVFDLASVEDDAGMYAFQVKEMDVPVRSAHLNNVLHIVLSRPAKAGEQRRYEIDYMGTPKDGLIISKNKFGDRTFFADNWPNRAHQWIPCVDRPDDKAAFEFVVKAPDQYQVISNGVKVSESKLDGHRKMWTWKETTPLPTKVMVIGVARFAIREYPQKNTPVPVSAWVFPQDSSKGFYDYGIAPEIVNFFSGYIAPFPYQKLANVQSKTIFGGMENAGAIFYAEESVTGDRKWEDVIAHEIVHQWFGDMATEKSFAHLWLSEGFANYLTDIYIEKKYGHDAFIKRLQKERSDIILFAKSSQHPVVDSTDDLMSLLNTNSYQKGGWVLHMLRMETGDSLFQKIIQQYYRQYAGRNAETRDFERVAEQVSQKDLSWFFNQWLYRPGIPELDIKIKTGKDGVNIKISQGKQLFRLVMEMEVKWIDGTVTRERIRIQEKETEFEVKGKGVVSVVMDPETRLLFTETK